MGTRRGACLLLLLLRLQQQQLLLNNLSHRIRLQLLPRCHRFACVEGRTGERGGKEGERYEGLGIGWCCSSVVLLIGGSWYWLVLLISGVLRASKDTGT